MIFKVCTGKMCEPKTYKYQQIFAKNKFIFLFEQKKMIFVINLISRVLFKDMK